MTTREKAARFDAEDRPIEAIEAYEALLAKSGADLDSILNLALLYFQCWDYGYASHHDLPEELVAKSLTRAMELLAIAESKFGKKTEIEFWKLYFNWVALGGAEFYDRCKELTEQEFSLIPFFYLVSSGSPEREKYWTEVKRLYEFVKRGETAKNRYIRSFLESAMGIRRPKDG